MQIRKLSVNKKAATEGRKIVFYIVFGFVATIVFLFIVWLTASDKSGLAEIPIGMENYLISQRFLNSPQCFALKDEDLGRVFAIIDFNKFNQEILDKCYNAKNTNVKAYRLTLNYRNEKKILSTRNWEGFLRQAEVLPILVASNGEIERGELFVEMQDAK